MLLCGTGGVIRFLVLCCAYEKRNSVIVDFFWIQKMC